MKLLYLINGLPYSGKTTYINSLLKFPIPQPKILNLEDYHDLPNSKNCLFNVFQEIIKEDIRFIIIESLFLDEIDKTNYKRLGVEYGYTIIEYNIQIDKDTLISRFKADPINKWNLDLQKLDLLYSHYEKANQTNQEDSTGPSTGTN